MERKDIAGQVPLRIYKTASTARLTYLANHESGSADRITDITLLKLEFCHMR